MSSSSSKHSAAPAYWNEFDEGKEEFFAMLAELSANPPAEVLAWLNAYFGSKAEGREFKRKPSARFRSMFEERQVDVQPRWRNIGTYAEKKVVLIPGELHFQLNAFSDKYKAYRWVLQVRGQPSGRFTYCGLSGGYRRGLEELLRLRRFFEAATADREGTLRAGAAGSCCFCGKPLTDPVSMNRGIGPECYRDFIGFTSVQPHLTFNQEGGE